MIHKLKKMKRRIMKDMADQRFYRELYALEKKVDRFSISDENRRERLIVSLTTYGSRIRTADIPIKSMLCQTYRPDKIILYLGDDVNEKDVPRKLLELTKYGLEIRFQSENLRSHKKYIYAMKDYPGDLIVTIDDDLLYPEYLLECLMQEHKKYPQAVIASRVHEMRFDEEGRILPYMQWGYEYDASKDNASLSYMATGGAGTLYPPGALEEVFFSKDLIKELSYTTDDLWLKVGEIKAGVPVKMASKKIWKNTYELPTANKDALSNKNVYGGKNDANMKKIMEYFHITREDFMK